MLADIDRALKKATRCEHDFGNWLVILSGDEADGDEAEIEAGSDEDVPGGADPIVRSLALESSPEDSPGDLTTKMLAERHVTAPAAITSAAP